MSCIDGTRHPLVSAELLVAAELPPQEYVGCPNCFKRVRKAEGRLFHCNSHRCHREVCLTRLERKTYFAGDTAGQNYLLEFIPFNFSFSEAVSLVGKIVRLRGVELRMVSSRSFGFVPSVCVLGCEVIGDVLSENDDIVSVPIGNGQTWPELLKGLYDRQPTQKRGDGLALELVGLLAAQEVQQAFPSFGFDWPGIHSYLGYELQSGPDFVLRMNGQSQTDQFKNTSGTYYLSQYQVKRFENHFVVGAVFSENEARGWARAHGASITIVGKQITSFPLTDAGSIKSEYQEALRVVRDSILERIVMPNVIPTGGYI